MRETRTNLSINIQFNNVQEVEKVLYKILNELDAKENFGSGEVGNVSFNYAQEKFTVEAMTNGTIVKTFKSKI